MLFSQQTVNVADYWTESERNLDINTKEAMALNKVLLSFSDAVKNTRVDAVVDNKALCFSWQKLTEDLAQW